MYFVVVNEDENMESRVVVKKEVGSSDAFALEIKGPRVTRSTCVVVLSIGKIIMMQPRYRACVLLSFLANRHDTVPE